MTKNGLRYCTEAVWVVSRENIVGGYGHAVKTKVQTNIEVEFQTNIRDAFKVEADFLQWYKQEQVRDK